MKDWTASVENGTLYITTPQHVDGDIATQSTLSISLENLFDILKDNILYKAAIEIPPERLEILK